MLIARLLRGRAGLDDAKWVLGRLAFVLAGLVVISVLCGVVLILYSRIDNQFLVWLAFFTILIAILPGVMPFLHSILTEIIKSSLMRRTERRILGSTGFKLELAEETSDHFYLRISGWTDNQDLKVKSLSVSLMRQVIQMDYDPVGRYHGHHPAWDGHWELVPMYRCEQCYTEQLIPENSDFEFGPGREQEWRLRVPVPQPLPGEGPPDWYDPGNIRSGCGDEPEDLDLGPPWPGNCWFSLEAELEGSFYPTRTVARVVSSPSQSVESRYVF